MHNKKNYLKVGDFVKLDKPIAEMGKTGSVLSKEGIHLHFDYGKMVYQLIHLSTSRLDTIDSEIKINN